jgi:aspartate carbamoyltransferase catalytic subunit
MNFHVINAGAGRYEHPTQSLLDLFTIQQEFKKTAGLTVLICGDIKNSRVASSNIKLFAKMGMQVQLAGPELFLPKQEELLPNVSLAQFDQALPHCDVAIFLRVQHERHDAIDLNINDYHHRFGLTLDRIHKLQDHAIIMHPAPVNRGVEIASELVEHTKSRIFSQVKNGLYTRMAILEWITEFKG